MSTNYKSIGSPQSAPGGSNSTEYGSQAWEDASANAHSLWASIIAAYPTVDAFLAQQNTKEALHFYHSLIVNVTQADCTAAGCSSEFAFFNGIINWTTSLAAMKAAALTYTQGN